MNKVGQRSTWSIFAVALAMVSGGAFADNAQDPQAIYQEALQDYNQRSSTDHGPTDRAIEKLSKIENKASDTLNYDILILLARSYYWKGTHLKDRNQVMETHLKGQTKADAAVKLNSKISEGHYYAGINLARWGEANGIIPSLSKLGALKAYMAEATKNPTRAGAEGKTVDGYGPSRVLGRIFFKLPTVFGGSHKKSVDYLKAAYENAKELAINVVYYAETLKNGNDEEKVEAKKILEELLANNPETYNKDRIPETIEEFKEGQDLKDQM